MKPPTSARVLDYLHNLLNSADEDETTLSTLNKISHYCFDLTEIKSAAAPSTRRLFVRDSLCAFRHLFPNNVARRALLDFLKSNLCASLPCSLLMREKNVEAVKYGVADLKSFIECTHGSSTTGQQKSCASCVYTLGRTACRYDSIIPTVSKLVMVIAESEISGRLSGGFNLAKSINNLLSDCLKCYITFQNRFTQVQDPRAKEYSDKYQHCSTDPSTQGSSTGALLVPVCLSEAGRTG